MTTAMLWKEVRLQVGMGWEVIIFAALYVLARVLAPPFLEKGPIYPAFLLNLPLNLDFPIYRPQNLSKKSVNFEDFSRKSINFGKNGKYFIRFPF